MKLELGSGDRPTPGYVHTDPHPFTGLDHVGGAHDLEFPSESFDEVLALGVIEHMTYRQVAITVENVHKWLVPGGIWLFDVPDFPVWAMYAAAHAEGRSDVPFDLAHVMSTIYGWQRWEGDEHKSGWSSELLRRQLAGFGHVQVDTDGAGFVARGHDRRRFHRPADAHLYVVAVKA